MQNNFRSGFFFVGQSKVIKFTKPVQSLVRNQVVTFELTFDCNLSLSNLIRNRFSYRYFEFQFQSPSLLGPVFHSEAVLCDRESVELLPVYSHG